MDKYVIAVFTGALVAMTINSFVLYQVTTKRNLECYFKAESGKEVYVTVGYNKPSVTLYSWWDRDD